MMEDPNATQIMDALISDIYAAANGRRHWPDVLASVADALNVWTVQLLGVDKRRSHLIFSTHGGRAGPEVALDYFRTYHAIDPRIPLGVKAGVGQWIHCHEHFDEAYVASSPFYQHFLIPHGCRWVSGTSLIDNDEVAFLVGFLRTCGSKPMQAHEMDRLDRVSRHLGESLQNVLHLRDAYAELSMARELLGQFRHPMVLLDDTRGIWHRNAAAQALMDRRCVIDERRGFLTCFDRGSDHALTEAIHGLDLTSIAMDAPRARRCVPLTGSDGGRYLAFVSAVRPHQTMGVFGHAAQALVVLHEPAGEQAGLDPFIVGECFDLTPAEARIAVRLVSGASAKDIARQSGVALATVRVHIQRVMDKMDADRQSDVIRMLLALPARA